MKIIKNEDVIFETREDGFNWGEATESYGCCPRFGFLQGHESCRYYAVKSVSHGYVTPIYIFDTIEKQKNHKGSKYIPTGADKEFYDSVGWVHCDEIFGEWDKKTKSVTTIKDIEGARRRIIGKPIMIYFQGCDDGHFATRFKTFDEAINWIENLPCEHTGELFYELRGNGENGWPELTSIN